MSHAMNIGFLKFLAKHKDFEEMDQKKFTEIAAALEQQWTNVEDRLPKPHEHFLALNSDGRIFESCMCYGMHKPFFTYPYGDGSASNTLPAWIDVTYWMPKPELPEGM